MFVIICGVKCFNEQYSVYEIMDVTLSMFEVNVGQESQADILTKLFFSILFKCSKKTSCQYTIDV